jgi:hypothetical protein
VDGTVAGVEERQTRNGRYYSVVFTYKVDGEWYSGTYTDYGSVRVGDSIPVRYDPKNPEHNDLVDKEKRLHWYIVIGVVVVIGIIIFCVTH